MIYYCLVKSHKIATLISKCARQLTVKIHSSLVVMIYHGGTG